MGNVNSTPEKPERRRQLFRIGLETVEKHLGRVEKIPRLGKASVRLAVRGNKRHRVTIRTTQDGWIAFQRNGKGWNTLADMDWVVVVSVDNRDDPKFALSHIISGDEMRDRFDRAYSARIAAGHSIPAGQPMWVSLYDEETDEPVSLVAAGAGLANPPVVRVPLQPGDPEGVIRKEPDQTPPSFERIIADAKRGLSIALGVDISRIKIIVEV